MTRKVKIGIVSCEVSKNEAKEVQRLMTFAGNDRQRQFESWLEAGATPEARARRRAVGDALLLRVPKV